MSTETSADWCVSDGQTSICGTRMVERSREPDGKPRWCFVCRKRRDFVFVVTVPDGMSYYGPDASVRCATCNTSDGDCFPGRYRTWGDDLR